MDVNLPVTTAIEYFEKVGKKIDYKRTGNIELMSDNEATLIQRILSCEVSINLMRGATGCDGSLIDEMVSIRRGFIKSYESKFKKKYVEYNDFY